MSGFACPSCGSTDTLYENIEVPGWRGLDSHLNLTGAREVFWEKAVADAIGCSCEWEGVRADLTALGTDGAPLPEVHPAQETLL